MRERHHFDGQQLLAQLREWAHGLGFSQIGVAGVDLAAAEPGMQAWLAAGFHGSMAYMAAHGLKRARPAELVPGTASVVTVRMDYLPRASPADWVATESARPLDPAQGVISIYARGRDYHKVLRARLQALADRLAGAIGPFGHRVFTDSAPVLEVELAARSGIGWRGKHTLALHREGGSMFFLGELFVDFALPPTPPVQPHCGTCSACIEACPTQAIVAPYRLDARRCISYLTIEHDGPIPVELRAAVGNRIYGCDDCQLVCPWNKYARLSALTDFVQMLAPIALYPDALLSQVLMASTYPADVAEAAKWSKANAKQKGDAAVTAVQDKPWDNSVKSLVAFPQALATLAEKPQLSTTVIILVAIPETMVILGFVVAILILLRGEPA